MFLSWVSLQISRNLAFTNLSNIHLCFDPRNRFEAVLYTSEHQVFCLKTKHTKSLTKWSTVRRSSWAVWFVKFRLLSQPEEKPSKTNVGNGLESLKPPNVRVLRKVNRKEVDFCPDCYGLFLVVRQGKRSLLFNCMLIKF